MRAARAGTLIRSVVAGVPDRCVSTTGRVASPRELGLPPRTLEKFLLSHRAEIIARTAERVTSRQYQNARDIELANGIPVFLDQLGDALRRAVVTDEVDHDQIDASATRHGRDLLRMGLTIGQVVHGYGDVCQAVTELAVKHRLPVSGDEFRTLNLCLDDAIASAVTGYAGERERAITASGVERLGILAHELRNLLNVAALSFDTIMTGRVAPGGSTAQMHGRTLMRLRDLVDRSLAEVRLDAGLRHVEAIAVVELLEEVEIGAMIQAKAKNLRFVVAPANAAVTIRGDRQILAAALTNLLQNAFKFTRKASTVSLTAHVSDDRVRFDIEDECGGLPPGKAEDLFRPYEQRGSDQSGLGLGLAICTKAAKANHGELRVRDLPGKGCIFTLDLPR